MSLAALILVAAGPFSWLQMCLHLAVTSYRSEVFRYAFARQIVPKLIVHLSLSPVLVAVLGTAAFILGLGCVAMSKHRVVVRPKLEAAAESAPLELSVPEWMSRRGGA